MKEWRKREDWRRRKKKKRDEIVKDKNEGMKDITPAHPPHVLPASFWVFPWVSASLAGVPAGGCGAPGGEGLTPPQVTSAAQHPPPEAVPCGPCGKVRLGRCEKRHCQGHFEVLIDFVFIFTKIKLYFPDKVQENLTLKKLQWKYYTGKEKQ